MTDCCANHSKKEDVESIVEEKPPKSFFGKFLYNLGKSDYENERQKKDHKKGCC